MTCRDPYPGISCIGEENRDVSSLWGEEFMLCGAGRLSGVVQTLRDGLRERVPVEIDTVDRTILKTGIESTVGWVEG